MVFLWEGLGAGTLLGAMAAVKCNPLLVLAWKAVRPAWYKCWPTVRFLVSFEGLRGFPRIFWVYSFSS